MHIFIQILKYFFYTINCLVLFYFLLPVILHFIYFLIGGYKKVSLLKNNNEPINIDYDFAAIVAVHQDIRFIKPLVDSFLKQNYNKFIVYIVADDCDLDGLRFTDERIVLIKPLVPLHSKIKSIELAISNFKNKHEVLIIFDSDNLVHPNYLKNLNKYFQNGFKVVQTHMLSKNIENTYARLDSIGHIYYTFYERQVKMKLGLSSSILGLGIAIKYDLYKEISYGKIINAFDKKLQVDLAIKVKQIAFAEDAIVYDEKVETASVLEKQRIRWIYSYFGHFRLSFKLTTAGFRNLNIGQILLGASMLRPPMILLIIIMIVLLLFSFFINIKLSIIWVIVLILFVINFILTIATQSVQKGMMKSIKYLPLLILSQLKSLMKIKKAKNSYLKTEHVKIIYIDELLSNEQY